MNGESLSKNGSTSNFDLKSNVILHPAAQPARKQQEYELRLLSLWIDLIKQTGEIDYPELVTYLNQVFEVENAPAYAVLTPTTIDTLVANLRAAQADILVSAGQIQKSLQQLGDAIALSNLTQTQEQEIEQEIRQGTERFLLAIEWVLDISDRYAYNPLPKPAKKGEVTSNDIDAEWIRKLMNDLKYIRQYIAEQAQVRIVKSEFLPGDSQKSYFRRIDKYLEIVPGLAEILGNFVQKIIERKVAGGDKFILPKLYAH